MKLRIAYGRHYCTRCHQRCFPYDTLERRTEAPEGILLASLNSKLGRKDASNRVAWCWRCNRWTETYQETLAMLARRYARRKGVHVREAQIIPLRKRRSA